MNGFGKRRKYTYSLERCEKDKEKKYRKRIK